MTKEQEESLKKLRRQIIAEKYTKNIGIPVYISDLKNVLSILKEKDKQIDLTAEYISNITDCPFESEGKYLDCEKMCDVRTDKECWKQYFENKAKEVK